MIKRLIILFVVSVSIASCFKDSALIGIFISCKSVNLRFDQSMVWNSTHPFKVIEVPSDDYTLLSMGDSHAGSTINLDRFFNIAKTAHVSAVVMVGDLTNGHAGDYALFEQHLPDQDSLTTFPIVGNHDLHYEGWDEFYARFGSSTYIFTVKTPVEELQVLLELFTKYHVDMVITGHDHKHNAEFFGITWYIVMDALEDGLSNAGYLKLNVKKGQIVFTFKNI